MTCALLFVGVTHAIGMVGHVQQCEKDGKVYVERVPGSEQGFEHLTEREDMAVS